VYSVSWDRNDRAIITGKAGKGDEGILDLDRVSDLEMEVSFRAREQAKAFDQRK
jgi:hypothetical protein